MVTVPTHTPRSAGAPPPCRRHGFTVLEVLTVLFIVGILVAFVTELARHGSETAQHHRAATDLRVLGDALDRFALRFGGYPGTPNIDQEATNLLSVATSLPGSEVVYLFRESLPAGFTAVDPWGKPYRYRREQPSPDAEETVALSSWGPDRTAHTADDIRPNL